MKGLRTEVSPPRLGWQERDFTNDPTYMRGLGRAKSSTEDSSSTSAAAVSEQAPDTSSTVVVEELKKEFEQYNQHNLPRDKKKAEEHVPRRTRSPSKKDYQRSRGRNKR